MKSLKFDPEKAKLILAGKKNTTWRLFDDKNLTIGDLIEIIAKPEMKVVGKAKIISVVEKKLSELAAADLKDHQAFTDTKTMYRLLGGYYNREVGPKTPIKIVRFQIVAQ